MTPLERAQRAVAQWDYHWMKSIAVNVLLMNIKREIEEAVHEAQQTQDHAAVSAEGAAWAADYNPMVNVGNDMWKNDPPYPQCTCRVIDGKHDPHCPGSPEYWQKRQP